MHRLLVTQLALVSLALAPSAHAANRDADTAPPSATHVQRLVREDLAAGRINYEDYLLQNFRLAFAPGRANADYTRGNTTMEPCFTPWIAEFEQNRGRLSQAAVTEIEGYLHPQNTGLRDVYVSPSGRFALTYDLTGANAVPTTDVSPADGIPDFVEHCADYYDTSWNTEITTLGFTTTALPGDGTYDCFVQALSSGLFGFTSVTGPLTTQITIDNDFIGVGHVPSTDPDGAQLGRAKGTIAHEFKHSSQYTQSGWTEGNWNELDANWIMDVVFDASDIYLAWLTDPTSQLISPQTTLTDDNGQGYYEDLIWETYMGERFGVQSLVDYGARRAAHRSEGVKISYNTVLQTYGSSWDDAYPEYMEWCWFTGSRAQAGVGFSEGNLMTRMNLLAPAVSTYPYADSSSVAELAGHHRRFNPGTGAAEIKFNGDDAHCCFTVSVLTRDSGGNVTISEPALAAGNDLDYTVPIPWSNLQYVGVIVTNTQRSGQGAKFYTLEVDDVPPVTGAPLSISAPDAQPTLSTGSPNPFNSSTRIAYSMPQSSTAILSIYDVRGRMVRNLVDRVVEGGAQHADWDGRDDAGHPVPAGIYWSRLETPWGKMTQKIARVR